MRRRAFVASLTGAALCGCLSAPTATDSPPSDSGGTETGAQERDELDEAMESALETLGAPGGVVAVANKQGLVSERSYGYRDRDRSDPMTTDSLFRIASLTKAFTRAAVMRLREETALTGETQAFERLDIEPIDEPEQITEQEPDERLSQITVDHLLTHQSGLNYGLSALYLSRVAGNALQLGRPATTREIVRYAMRLPLAFTPGTRQEYSNLGYTILELLIEQVRNRSYLPHLKETILDPIDVTDIYQAQSFPDDRPPREVEYDDSAACFQYDVLEERREVPCADGGINMSTVTGSAGLIATAPAVAQFLRHYSLETGEPLRGQWYSEEQSGLFTHGAVAFAGRIQRGHAYVTLFNSDSEDRGLVQASLRNAMLSFTRTRSD